MKLATVCLCYGLITVVQCLRANGSLELGDIDIRVHRYKPVKCGNMSRGLVVARKMPSRSDREHMRAFRYINIGGSRPSFKSANEVIPHRSFKCIKCPSVRIFSPGKYQDGVVAEMPSLTSCSGFRVPPDRYSIETFFSPATSISLAEGSHSFLGRIRSTERDEVMRVCNVRIKVKVRRCPKFANSDPNLRVFCDLGNVWGSKCKFTCRNNATLSSNQPIYCSDDLQWTGKPPYCKTNRPGVNEKPFNPVQVCTLPRPEPATKFSCDTPVGNWDIRQDEMVVPEGTVCRLRCLNANEVTQRDEGHFCWNGRWNGTFSC